MCRHLAYLGRPIPAAELLIDAPHSLLHQSYAPCDMRCAAVANADGFGFGWYSGDTVRRYRRDCPMWVDAGVDAIARSVVAPAFLGAVRSATSGMPVIETACAPFASGHWLFSHNGLIAGWPDSVASVAAIQLPTVELLRLDAVTDSALLWALLKARLAVGQEPANAIADVVAEVAAAAPGSRLNLLLTDGSAIYANTWSHALCFRRDDSGVVVASEPLDESPGWQQIADRQVITASPEAVALRPLPTSTSTATASARSNP